VTTKDWSAAIAGFRRAAELLELHPEIAKPYVTDDGELRWHLYAWECPNGVPAMVAKIRRAVRGKWTKRETNPYYGEPEMIFERKGYSITVKREAVCTRRVVGTETVTLPAVKALPERTEVREVVEWDCEPVLARAVPA